jgi:hypothetical protein
VTFPVPGPYRGYSPIDFDTVALKLAIDALNALKTSVDANASAVATLNSQVATLNSQISKVINLPYGVAGVTAGFQSVFNGGNGVYPTLASVSQSNGTSFTSNGIQVPAAGIYLIVASAYFSGAGTMQCQQFIARNTTTTPPPAANRLNGGVQIWKGDGNDYTSNATTIRTLAANDIVRLYLNANCSSWGSTGIDGTSIAVRCLTLS